MAKDQLTLNIIFGIALIILIFCTAFQHSRIRTLEQSIQLNKDSIELNRDRTEDIGTLVLEMAKFKISEINLRRAWMDLMQLSVPKRNPALDAPLI